MSSKRFAGEVIWGSCALGFNETCFGFCVFADNGVSFSWKGYFQRGRTDYVAHGLNLEEKKGWKEAWEEKVGLVDGHDRFPYH